MRLKVKKKLYLQKKLQNLQTSAVVRQKLLVELMCTSEEELRSQTVNDDVGETSSSESEFHDEDDMLYYERAIQEIKNGDSYTCMICTVEMDYTCKMYACRKCYRIFDYDCIREWAVKSTEKTADRMWKCPNCYLVNKKVPIKDRPTCWCGKVINPEPNEFSPNSCGQTCNAPICQHGCAELCHLGPHPDCQQLITIKCRCGKSEMDIPCYQAKHIKKKFRCKSKCGLLLPCGVHFCTKTCHSGLCGRCPEVISSSSKIELKCYCGLHEKKEIKCKDIKVMGNKPSKDKDGNKWIGVFACDELREVKYNCNKHSFFEKCQSPPTISNTKPCKFSPKLLKTCPCGRTDLKDLGKPRNKCTDPISTCGNRCNRILKCGKHTCPFECHEGNCMDPCLQIDKVKCACEQSTFLVPCKFNGKPHCQIKCESLMSCRRHRCYEKCCSGRPQAQQRRKKTWSLASTNDLNDETLVEAEHVCLKDCNLSLSCGKHRCPRKCHPGKCPNCLESSSEDLVCPCGKTVVPAPVRCGVTLPPCHEPCIKMLQGVSECGHTPMPHTCHPLDQPCPPCTATVFKPCKCGKNDKVRTVCFQNDVSCGQICQKPLENCHHRCMRTCHRPDDDCSNKKCEQICGLTRLNCPHKCFQKCHRKEPCPDIICTAIVKMKCLCGRKQKEIICGANSTKQSNAFTEQLECDDQCEIYKRHQQLKEAFGIGKPVDTLTMGEDNNIENHDTTMEMDKLKMLLPNATKFNELELPFTESVIYTYDKQTKWCQNIEDTLNKLMDTSTRDSLHFKPMRTEQRSFIRQLAQSYDLYSESQDREPKRSVFVKKQYYNENDSENLQGISTLKSHKPVLSMKDVLPIYQQFKIIEKERKKQEFLKNNTQHLINIRLSEEDLHSMNATDNSDLGTKRGIEQNGLLISGLVGQMTVESVKTKFDTVLKSTLLKDIQYEPLDGNHMLVYPLEYENISTNAAKDLEMVVGFLDCMVKDEFMADSVVICDVKEFLHKEDEQEPELVIKIEEKEIATQEGKVNDSNLIQLSAE